MLEPQFVKDVTFNNHILVNKIYFRQNSFPGTQEEFGFLLICSIMFRIFKQKSIQWVILCSTIENVCFKTVT